LGKIATKAWREPVKSVAESFMQSEQHVCVAWNAFKQGQAIIKSSEKCVSLSWRWNWSWSVYMDWVG